MQGENPIEECIKAPTTVDPNQYTTHQSVFRVHSQYNLLMKMIKRWDSKETIFMVMSYIEQA